MSDLIEEQTSKQGVSVENCAVVSKGNSNNFTKSNNLLFLVAPSIY